MPGLPQPDLNKVISSKCQTFIAKFIESTKPQREYEFFGSAKIRGTRAYEIVTKIKSIQDVAIDNNIDINQKKSQIQKAIIDIEKNINDNLRLYVSNNDRARANVERFVSGLKKLNLDIDAALTPNSTINLRGLVQQQTVPKPVSSAVSAATPIASITDSPGSVAQDDLLIQLSNSKASLAKVHRDLEALISTNKTLVQELEIGQATNTQLDEDKQQLSDKNRSLLTETQQLTLELEKAITENKGLLTTVAITEREKLVLSDENEALKKQLSEIQTNKSDNNNTISQLKVEISTLKEEASVSGKQFLATEEEIARLKLEHEQEIARLNLQHEGETSSLKAMLQASQELLSKQTEQLQRTATDNEQLQAQRADDKGRIAALAEQLDRSSKENVDLQTISRETKKEMEAARTSVNVSSDKISTLNESQKQLQENNAVLEAKIAGLQQQISEQKLQTIPADDQKSKIEELTQANTVLAEQLAQFQAQNRFEIEAARDSETASSDEIITLKHSQQELTEKNTALQTHLDGLTEKNAVLQAQLDGLTEENAVLRSQSKDQQKEVELLKIESKTHLENAMARLREIQELKEQISNMEAAKKLATASSDNMANMADRIRELEQREQRLAVENTILKKQLQKSKPTTAALLSFSKPRPESIAPTRPKELSEPEPQLSITLVTPASPILTTEPTSPLIAATPTRPGILEGIAQELKTVTPTVSGGGQVVHIQQFSQEGEEKKPDRPYFDRANTQAINVDETNQLQTLFENGILNFSDQTHPNKIIFSNESMEPSDLQAMVAILQATSRDNKESTLNNVEVILTGKDEDLIRVLKQFHDKLAEAVQGNDDKKICAIKIQDKGEHNKELTYLIKLHNAAADIIHNKEELTPDKKNNILEAIQALQAQATKSPEPTTTPRRHSSQP